MQRIEAKQPTTTGWQNFYTSPATVDADHKPPPQDTRVIGMFGFPARGTCTIHSKSAGVLAKGTVLRRPYTTVGTPPEPAGYGYHYTLDEDLVCAGGADHVVAITSVEGGLRSNCLPGSTLILDTAVDFASQIAVVDPENGLIGGRDENVAGVQANGFGDLDLPYGVPPTELTANWMNVVQEALAKVVEGFNDTLSANDSGQLAKIVRDLQVGNWRRVSDPGFLPVAAIASSGQPGNGGLLFVAVGAESAAYTLDGGYTWSAPVDLGDGVHAVAFQQDKGWVAVGVGAAWTNVQPAPPASAAWVEHEILDGTGDYYGVCWTGTQWLAVGDSGRVVTSPDGVTWTLRTFPDAYVNLTCVASNGDGLCVAAGNDGSGGSHFYVSQDNGETWTDTGYSNTASVSAIAYDPAIGAWASPDTNGGLARSLDPVGAGFTREQILPITTVLGPIAVALSPAPGRSTWLVAQTVSPTRPYLFTCLDFLPQGTPLEDGQQVWVQRYPARTLDVLCWGSLLAGGGMFLGHIQGGGCVTSLRAPGS
jgi:hypothetical protein